jgi:peroxiredoxin
MQQKRSAKALTLIKTIHMSYFMNDETSNRNKKIINRVGIAFLIVAGLVLFNSMFYNNLISTGKTAPAWKLQRANGPLNSLSLSDLKGKTVIMDFWSTTCPPCLMEIPILKRVAADYKDKNLVVVGVSVGGDSLEKINAFTKRKKIDYPIVVDVTGFVANKYKITSLPTMYIINSKGKIVETHSGFFDEKSLREVLDNII